jgi:hypothetical protein
MASLLSIPVDIFINSWFETFELRDRGFFKNIEENILYIKKIRNFFGRRKN